MSGLAWCRDRVENPAQLARFSVECLQSSANCHFTASVTDDDHPVVIQRSSGDRIAAVLERLALHRPEHFAGLLIEGEELVIELPDEDLSLANADTTAYPAAANRNVGRIQVGFVFPQDLAGIDADRENIVVAGDRVQHAIGYDGLCLTGVAPIQAGTAQGGPPEGLHSLDVVAVYLRQGRVTLVEKVAAVGRPTRLRAMRVAGRRGRVSRKGSLGSSRCGDCRDECN